MQLSRSHQTATLLTNGTVLVAGGAGSNAQAESFSISSGLFQAAGSMTIGRTSHTATVMTDGRILMTGGTDGSGATLSSAELYDPTTGIATATVNGLQSPRSNHTATLLQNGRILITGGLDVNGVPLSTAELYDPSTGAFTPTGVMQVARSQHTATLLNDGRVLVVGGADYSTHQACNTVTGSCFNTTWIDGDLSAEIYDPATGLFSPTGSMQMGRWDHTATLLSNGQVLILAGWQASELHSQGPFGSQVGVWTVTADAELYDPVRGTFVPAGALNSGRGGHTATLLTSGQVLVAGGESSASTYSTTELYDPSAAIATAGPSLSLGRSHHTATRLLNGAILLAGGGDNSADLYWPNGVAVSVGSEQVANLGLSWGYLWNGYAGGPCNANWHTDGVTFSKDFNLSQVRVPNHNNGYGGGLYIYEDSTSTIYATSTGSNINFGDGVARFFFSNPLIRAGHTYFFDGDHVGPPGNDFSTGGYFNCSASIWDFYAAPIAEPGAAVATVTPPVAVFPSGTTILPIEVTNSGTLPLEITAALAITGFNASDFTLVDQTTSCVQGVSISPGSSCVVNVAFNPLTDSAEAASLHIYDNVADSPQTVSLSGGASVSSVTPNPVGGSSAAQTVTIVGTSFTSGSVINWRDLTAGGTGSVIPLTITSNVLTASMTFPDATAMWQIQVAAANGSLSNWYSFQVLADSGNSFHFENDYPFQNASYCLDSTPDKQCAPDTRDPYGFFFRECTSFIAWRMNRDVGSPDPRHPFFLNTMDGGSWGAANNWYSNAKSLGYSVDGPAAVGTIAQWTATHCGGNCPGGHVAYVEKVNGDGSIVVSEYNYAKQGGPLDHQYSVRPIPAGAAIFPEHFLAILKPLSVSDIPAFGNEPVGLSSSQTIMITNPNGVPVSLSNVTITGKNGADFGQTQNCTAGIPAGGSCTITVTFTPSAKGPRSASMAIKGTAGTQIVALTGTGLVGMTVSPKALTFGNVALGAAGTKSLTLTNGTGADLSIYSIASGSGAFAQSANTCGGSLLWKASCSITISFSPVTVGTQSVVLTISDSAIDAPQSVSLTGTGILPVVVNPTSVTFAARKSGTTAPTKTISVRNNLPVQLVIGPVTVAGNNAGDFPLLANSCGTLASGATCSINVAFAPSAPGSRVATLQISDTALTSPQLVSLTGTGK